jgi:type 1 fimbria pilin
MKKFAHTVLLVLIALLSRGAWAQCSINTGMPALVTWGSPGSISVNANLPVGTQLWSSGYQLGTLTRGGILSCTGTSRVNGLIKFPTALLSGPPYTYATNVPGIGVQVFNGSSTINGNDSGPGTLTVVYADANTPNPYDLSKLFTVMMVALVKTGPISFPATVSGEFMYQMPIGATLNTSKIVSYIFPTLTVTGVTPTCTVTTPSINVSLGNVPASALPLIGSTSSQVPFNIGLNCAGGDSGGSVPVSITFTDPSGATPNGFNTLYPSPDSTASGAYIQILYQGVPVNFSADTSHGNPNEIPIGNAQNGSFNIPLTARYIRGITANGTQLILGTANGLAQFLRW